MAECDELRELYEKWETRWFEVYLELQDLHEEHSDVVNRRERYCRTAMVYPHRTDIVAVCDTLTSWASELSVKLDSIADNFKTLSSERHALWEEYTNCMNSLDSSEEEEDDAEDEDDPGYYPDDDFEDSLEDLFPDSWYDYSEDCLV